MRCFVPAVVFALLLTGCAVTKKMTINTKPPDAQIKVDGKDIGKGKVTTPITWKDKNDKHTVTASRLGFKDQTITLKQDYPGDKVDIDLKPQTKRVTVTVSPVAGKISIDGKPVSNEPMDTV